MYIYNIYIIYTIVNDKKETPLDRNEDREYRLIAMTRVLILISFFFLLFCSPRSGRNAEFFYVSTSLENSSFLRHRWLFLSSFIFCFCFFYLTTRGKPSENGGKKESFVSQKRDPEIVMGIELRES